MNVACSESVWTIEGYYRADELYQEVELVLEATCTACSAGQ